MSIAAAVSCCSCVTVLMSSWFGHTYHIQQTGGVRTSLRFPCTHVWYCCSGTVFQLTFSILQLSLYLSTSSNRYLLHSCAVLTLLPG